MIVKHFYLKTSKASDSPQVVKNKVSNFSWKTVSNNPTLKNILTKNQKTS